ncbi:MAG TPA: sigma-70 family RNA polymerase sigma factor [Saprospiraceae bacterium]|nr:sigma-70 family RNA polymerase sigma factor [Saprospiraceae bacterium]HMP23728.1 sigma-70 family RNA polymerase sigma factor [Saprospiraceae bacterium]
MRFPFLGFSDKKLIEAIRGGAEHLHYEAALTHLYEKFRSKAIGYLLKNHRVSQNEAEEIASAALLSLIEKIQAGKDIQRSLLNYFLGIVTNTALNEIKRHEKNAAPLPREEIKQDDDTPAQLLLEKEEREIVEQILDQLPPHCRNVLLEVQDEEESIEELAERLGYASANTLYVTRNRCKQKLKEILQKEGYNRKDGKK